MIKKLIKEIKSICFFSLISLILLSLAYLIVSLVILYYSIEANKYEILNNESLLIDIEKAAIANTINNLATDVLYISDSLRIRNLEETDYSEIQKQWLAFANRRKKYSQIRFIDTDGKEIIKIRFSNGQAKIVKQADLQNDRDQNYFTNTIGLNEEEIFISKLYTNEQEDEVEQLKEPLFAIVTPYYAANGNWEGIIVLDYYADDMLRQVKKIAAASYGYIYMLNSDGYWIYNSANSNDEWFLNKDKIRSESFLREYSYEWDRIRNEANSFLNSSKGLFAWVNVLTSEEFIKENASYSISMEDDEWYIVSHISLNSLEGQIFSFNIFKMITYIFQENKFDFIFISLVAIIFGIQMTLSKMKKDEIKYFSEYDTLTDVYNRRIAFEKLDKIYKDKLKERGSFCVCFIDINGLKEINDTLGHEAGDELILSIVKGIKENINSTDLLARLGGDEFLVLFNNITIQEAEEIWAKVCMEFDKINESQNRKYIISVSHGIEEFKFEDHESIKTIINRADKKMYHEKRSIKQSIKLIRD